MSEEEWSTVVDNQPLKFDLVMVKDQFNRQQLAWWTGSTWDYGCKRVTGDIVKWKRLPQGYDL